MKFNFLRRTGAMKNEANQHQFLLENRILGRTGIFVCQIWLLRFYSLAKISDCYYEVPFRQWIWEIVTALNLILQKVKILHKKSRKQTVWWFRRLWIVIFWCVCNQTFVLVCMCPNAHANNIAIIMIYFAASSDNKVLRNIRFGLTSNCWIGIRV